MFTLRLVALEGTADFSAPQCLVFLTIAMARRKKIPKKQ
jgi:hypothetical protein